MDQRKSGLRLIQINDQTPDGAVGQAGIEHLDRSDGAGLNPEVFGEPFDASRPDQILCEVRYHRLFPVGWWAVAANKALTPS